MDNGRETAYVRAEHLNVGYTGETVVPDISFELTGGQAIALIGTNGSGKSTLLKTIVGLLPSLGGSCRCSGRRPAAAVPESPISASFMLPVLSSPFARLMSCVWVASRCTGCGAAWAGRMMRLYLRPCAQWVLKSWPTRRCALYRADSSSGSIWPRYWLTGPTC